MVSRFANGLPLRFRSFVLWWLLVGTVKNQQEFSNTVKESVLFWEGPDDGCFLLSNIGRSACITTCMWNSLSCLWGPWLLLLTLASESIQAAWFFRGLDSPRLPSLGLEESVKYLTKSSRVVPLQTQYPYIDSIVRRFSSSNIKYGSVV